MALALEAASRGDVEALRRLLDEHPGLIEAEDPGPLLVNGSCGGSVAVVRLLLDRGADMNTRHGAMGTPLMWACLYGHVGVVALLLGAGGPAGRLLSRHAGGGGHTALMAASCGRERPGSDHVAVIRVLFQDGRVPVDARDAWGRTALWEACRHGHDTRARVLLVEGSADHTVTDYQGLTPMAVARRWGREDCIRLLQWYEGEQQRAFLLSKARAVLDATHSISKAPDKARAQTQAEAQRAREEAAPSYLQGRVCRGEALPVLEVVSQAAGHHKEEEELCAVCGWLVGVGAEDLLWELMEGLRYRRWVPEEAKVEGGGRG